MTTEEFTIGDLLKPSIERNFSFDHIFYTIKEVKDLFLKFGAEAVVVRGEGFEIGCTLQNFLDLPLKMFPEIQEIVPIYGEE